MKRAKVRPQLLRGQRSKAGRLQLPMPAGLGKIPGSSKFTRPDGTLGQTDPLNDALRGFAAFRTYFYDLIRIRLPMTEEEFDSVFGRSFAIFSCDDGDSCERVTNASCGSSINTLFVATGIGIVGISEGIKFAVHGVDYPATTVAAAPQGTPRVDLNSAFTCSTDAYLGQANLATSDPGARHAAYWFGGPGDRIIEKFFQAFRFELTVNDRLKFVDESLLDIGLSPQPPEFQGASSSRVPTNPFIAATNQVMADKAIDHRFLTVNTFVSGEAELVCVGPPLAGVTYGHIDIEGLSNRVYPFATYLLWTPGMNFDMAFIPILDDSCFEALRSIATVTCETQTPEAEAGVVGGAPASCGVTCHIPGGTVTLGAVLTGFDLWPAACVLFVERFLYEGSMQWTALQDAIVNMQPQQLAGLLKASPQGGKLSGMVAGLEKGDRLPTGFIAGIEKQLKSENA